MDNDIIIKAYYTLKNTPEGQIILDDLQNKFFKGTLVRNTQFETILEVGAREVIVYILSKIEEFELENGRRGKLANIVTDRDAEQ